MNHKSILLLARRDHTEAMRVAAGLTIFGHNVRLVFMTGPVAETEANAEQAEMLDLAGIEPETTLTGQDIKHIEPHTLGLAMVEADMVVNL